MNRDHSPQTAHSTGLSNVIPFPRPQNPRGTIDIYPCASDGGGWAVEHMSRSGDSATFLGSFLSISEAVSFARHWATRLSADFNDGGAA
jgi:hypothetical protein